MIVMASTFIDSWSASYDWWTVAVIETITDSFDPIWNIIVKNLKTFNLFNKTELSSDSITIAPFETRVDWWNFNFHELVFDNLNFDLELGMQTRHTASPF